MSEPPKSNIPSSLEIRQKTWEILGYRPCLWQIRVVAAILKYDKAACKAVVAIAATGSGKTLTFWMPLLFKKDGIQIVITPLNILGKQNVASLAAMGIEGVTVTAENANRQTFKDIENLKYQVIVTNIEIFEEVDGPFDKLWKRDLFSSKVISIIWDEGHCVSKWADFRPEYKNAGRLRYLIPSHIPFYVTSATLPPIVLHDVMNILNMRRDNTQIIERSNDRHNISICVREMLHPANSYLDLTFLIPENLPPGWKPPKFLIFFDDITESIAVANFLRKRLPPKYRDMIKWFNSDMSALFRDVEAAKLKAGETWGLCCTDSFGMGMDLPDIALIIQWKATCDLCTLWQRFGRAVRDLKLVGKALFLVESKYFDATKQARIEAAEARKRKSAEQAGNPRPAKRARAAKGTSNSPIPQGSALPASQLTSEEVGAGSVLAADDNEGTANTPTESSTVTSPDIQTGTPTTALNDGPGNATAAVADDESRALFEVLRRAVYAEVPKTERKRTKRKVEEIEPALDDMINAGSRREVRCFRLPAMVYFGQRKNDSDHFACDPTNPAGCQRCIIRQPAVCCALCNPQIFTDFAHSDPALRPKRTRKRSSIPDYTPDQYDTGLRDALNEFREQETVKKFGKSRLKNSGPGLIMPNDILKRIIDCVHAQKITNKEDLQHETRWSRIDQFADAVLAIIDTCRRPSSSSSLTPEAASSVSTATNTKKVPKIGKSHCGACGEVGHNKSNTRCPKHPSKGKENIAPLPAPASVAPTSMTELSPPNPPLSGPFRFRALDPAISIAGPNVHPFLHPIPSMSIPSTQPTLLKPPNYSIHPVFSTSGLSSHSTILNRPPIRPNLFYYPRAVNDHTSKP